MKVGDLVKVVDSTCENGHWCGCWFCSNNSSRIGVIVRKHGVNKGPLTAVYEEVPSSTGGYWSVLFNAGEWRLYGKEMKLINECG